ncbi:MAG: fused MFS/spermidine synthase [Candidatus Riflebacteria bacterium]|nr:fused MFS/spermidine synthase [Candidatus Riflebacteria bacterium]
MLGGAVGVWTGCQLFFQLVLLAGYALAHLGLRGLGAARHPPTHALLLAFGLLSGPSRLGRLAGLDAHSAPVWFLFRELGGAVGFPLLVMAALAPALQAWFAVGTRPGDGDDPYPLYAASNLGSLSALLAYPLLIEPFIPLTAQAGWWEDGYFLLVLLVVGCAVSTVAVPGTGGAATSGQVAASEGPAKPFSSVGRPAGPSGSPTIASPVSWSRRCSWLGWAFLPTSLMLGITSQTTMDMAPFPLLWTLPLAVYLLTWMMAFARSPRWRAGAWLDWAVPGLLAWAAVIHVLFVVSPAWLVAGFYLAVLFVAGLECHGRLFLDRPETQELTGFYLVTAMGGALGGMFNGWVAPQVFRRLHELPLVLVAIALAFSAVRTRSSGSLTRFWKAAALPLAVGGCFLWFGGLEMNDQFWFKAACLASAVALAALGGLHGVLFGPLFALALAGGSLICFSRPGVLAEARSFFGTYRIQASATGAHRYLMHGNIHHGGQKWLPPGERNRPFYYYIREGPVGEVFRELRRRRGRRICVVGLGAGTLACYLRPWQEMVFLEIDPVMARLAADPSLFSFLADAAGPCRVVEGDARVSLASRVQGPFDLIVLDAYSSDAIPLHLLTREALDVYLSRLAPDGWLMFHVSHRTLDLEPVVGNLALAAGLSGLSAGFRPDQASQRLKYDDEDTPFVFSSHWLILARSPDLLAPFRGSRLWKSIRVAPGSPVWTDEMSSVLSAYTWE